MKKTFGILLVSLLVLGITMAATGCKEVAGNYSNVGSEASTKPDGEIQKVTLEWKSIRTGNYLRYFFFHFRTADGKERECEVCEKDYCAKFPGDRIEVMVWKNRLKVPQFQG